MSKGSAVGMVERSVHAAPMGRRRWWVGGGTAAAVLAALLYLTFRAGLLLPERAMGDKPGGKADLSADAQLLRMRQELDQVRRESGQMRQLAQTLVNASERPTEEKRNAGAPASAPQATPAPAPKGIVSEEGSWTHVEAEFAGQNVDTSWNAGRELRAKMNQLPKGSAMRSLDCRQSMCRMETTHTSTDAYREFTKTLAGVEGNAAWQGASMFKILHEPQREGDELTAVAYLARDSFPSPDTP